MFWFVFVCNFNVRVLIYIRHSFLMWPEDIIFFLVATLVSRVQDILGIETLLSSETTLACIIKLIYAFATVGLSFYVGVKALYRLLSGFSFPYLTIVLAIQFETNNSRNKSKSKLTLISIKYFVCIFVKDKRLIRLYWMLFILLLFVTVACHRCCAATLAIARLSWTRECTS